MTTARSLTSICLLKWMNKTLTLCLSKTILTAILVGVQILFMVKKRLSARPKFKTLKIFQAQMTLTSGCSMLTLTKLFSNES